MKRIFSAFLLLLFVFLGCPFAASAAEVEDYIGQTEQLLPEGVPTADALEEHIGVEAIFEELALMLRGEIPSASSFFLFVLGVAVLLSVAGALTEGKGELGGAMLRATEATLALTLYIRMSELITDTLAVTRSLGDFCATLIPVFVGVNVAGGSEQVASASASGMGILVALLEKLLSGVAAPMLAMLMAFSLVGAIGEEGGVGELSGKLSKLFLWLVGIVSTVLSATLSLQQVLASSADSAAMRAMKYATSGMIPIVGSTVSGALSTLGAGVLYVKSTVGTLALFGILSLALPTLIKLCLYRLCLECAITLCTVIGNGGRLLVGFRRCLDCLCALHALGTVLFVLEVVLFMKSGVAIL